jgi:hypothetical protein
MLANEFLVNYTFRNIWIDSYQHNPPELWHWLLPYNIAIKLAFIALIFVRGRVANIAVLIGLILLFLLPYWHH